jgi:heat shock protein HslJ
MEELQMNGENLAIVILVSDAVSTEMHCMAPEGVMEQEQVCLAALASATSYRFARAGLELLDAMGSVVLVFEPAP